MAYGDWESIEQDFQAEEKALLAKEGVHLSDDHLDGYKYTPTKKVTMAQPWDTIPVINAEPSCTSADWRHTDVDFQVAQGIAYVTLNCPSTHNALTQSVLEGLHDAVCELKERRDVRVVVLRAVGKMFSVGTDPKSFAEAAAMTDVDSRKATVDFMCFLRYFQNLPQFSIGLCQGSAMGGGIGLLAVCDMVVAVRDARFAVSEVKLGTVPAAIAPFLTQKIGVSRCKRLLCSAETLTPEAAKSFGLVQEVVDTAEEFSAVVKGICEKMTLCAPGAVQSAKRLVQNVGQQPLSVPLLDYTGSELANIRIGEEAVRGMACLLAREKPFWAKEAIKPLD